MSYPSYLQASAEACERILMKHEGKTHRIEAIRVDRSILAKVRAQGFTVGRTIVASKPKRQRLKACLFRDNPHSPGCVAAREWLNQSKPRAISQKAMAEKHGVSQSAVWQAVNRERRRRRKAYVLGNPRALLATQKKAA